jgi:hypothetical protein
MIKELVKRYQIIKLEALSVRHNSFLIQNFNEAEQH